LDTQSIIAEPIKLIALFVFESADWSGLPHLEGYEAVDISFRLVTIEVALMTSESRTRSRVALEPAQWRSVLPKVALNPDIRCSRS
jgi:hypothetical protein